MFRNTKKNIFIDLGFDEYLANVVTFAIFFLMFCFIDVIFFIFTRGTVKPNILVILFINLAISLIFSSLIKLFNKIVFIIVCVLTFILILLCVLEIAIHSTFASFMPISSILQNTFNVLNNYGKETISIATSFILPFAIMLIFSGFSLYLYSELNKTKFDVSNLIHYLILGLGAIILVFTIFLINVKVGFSYNVERYGFKAALFLSPIVKNEKIDTKGLTINNSLIKKQKVFSNDYNILDIDFEKLSHTNDEDFNNINKYLATLLPSNKNEYTGIFKGKNLILICAEAYSHYVLDKELTPTLYRLTKNGFRFNDFYVPSWGGSTSSGEYSFLTGLIACDEASTMKETVGKNMHYTMPRVLKNFGYETAAYHNGTYDYYERNITHGKNLGFDKFLAIGNGLEDIAGKWPTDMQMIEETFKTYKDKAPFCMYYMTVSGHAFYNDDENFKVVKSIEKVKERHGNRYPKQVMNYICYQMYLEDALKKLVDLLTENDMIDNTVICLVADHFPYGLNSSSFTDGKDYLKDLYEDNNIDTFEVDKNMPILWCGSLENEHSNLKKDVNSPSSTIDLLPTLLNLFGVEFDSRLLPGRDVFSSKEAMVVYNDGKFIVDKGRYSPEKRNMVFDKKELPLYIEVAKNKILYSSYVLRTDYFNKIFKDDKY